MSDDFRSKQILIVDDEPDVCALIERFLRREGYAVYTAGDGEAMREIMSRIPIDLIILDVRLPGDDGFALARELRQRSTVAIIMLTVKDDVIDRVVGLESGADDYLPKPFHPRELLARIQSVLRRTATAEPAASDQPGVSLLCFGAWRINRDTRQLFSESGDEVPLSPAEYDLLIALLEHPNRVLTRDFLLTVTRGRYATPFDRAIDVQISNLRRKLERNPKQPSLIKTVRNTGYMLTATVKRQ